jgi:hypothetical protein
MSGEPAKRDSDFDRDFWRAHARRDLQQAFRALEDGRIVFGSWERLYLSAAIDNFRYGHFEQSARSAQRVLSAEQKSQPFPGRFGQEKSLADCRAEYEELVRR